MKTASFAHNIVTSISYRFEVVPFSAFMTILPSINQINPLRIPFSFQTVFSIISILIPPKRIAKPVVSCHTEHAYFLAIHAKDNLLIAAVAAVLFELNKQLSISVEIS